MHYSAQHRKKALGQNFLIDPLVIHNIVSWVAEYLRASCVKELVEIGPGRLALTLPLLEHLAGLEDPPRLHVVEKDQHLLGGLSKAQQHFTTLQIHHADVLVFDAWPVSYGVVSNLPYSCSVAILNHLALLPGIAFMVLMFQREVAQRILALPGDAQRGSLSCFIQHFWTVRHLTDVASEAFKPKPNVLSSVLSFEPLQNIRRLDPVRWSRFLKQTFYHPRKMLRSQPLWQAFATLDKARHLASLRPHMLTQDQLHFLFDLWNGSS